MSALTLTSSLLASLLEPALAQSLKGAAVIEAGPGAPRFIWANDAFCALMGRPVGSFNGADANGALGALWASDPEALASALRGDTAASVKVARAGGSPLQASLEGFKTDAGAFAVLWAERIDEYAAMRQELSEARKLLATGLAFDEKTGLLGAKAFWKAVGAQWSLCARHELPVSFAMVVVRPSGGQEQDADFEAAAKNGFARSVRRASDLVARLSSHSFGVFTAGQEPEKFEERLGIFASHLAEGFKASIGVCSMTPMQGSTPQVIKALAKKAMDEAFSQPGPGSRVVVARSDRQAGA